MANATPLVNEAAVAVGQLPQFSVARPGGQFSADFSNSFKAAMSRLATALVAVNQTVQLLEAARPLTSLENVGDGAGVFLDKAGQIGRLRTLAGVDNVNVVTAGNTIQIGSALDLVALTSANEWMDDAQPPAGTRATPYLPVLPESAIRARLKSLTYWNALAPGGGEMLTLRVYKYLANGSGYVLMTDPLVVNSTFSDFVTVDVSSRIRNLFWAPGDILALSRVYVMGAGRLQAPLISWDFELVPDTTLAGPSVPLPPVWPPA